MKTSLLALAGCLFACLATLRAEEPTGRYVIVAGTVSMANGQDKKVILKIDTTTGATWQFIVCTFSLPDGSYKTVDGWTWVPKDADADLQELLKQEPNAKLLPAPRKP